jgi:hypothetical protein
MNKAKLLLLGVLAAAVAVTGCTAKMAKNDAAAPAAEPAAEASGAGVAAQPAQDAAAAPAAETTPAADASAPAGQTAAPAADAAAASAPAAAESAAATEPPAADQNTPAATADQDAAKQAAALLPLPPAEITDTIQKLTHNPRVRYLSRTAQYDYYVGGRLDAKYDLNDNQLIVTSDGEGDPVKCAYGKDGAMVSDGKVPPKVVGTCNALINELGGYLSH